MLLLLLLLPLLAWIALVMIRQMHSSVIAALAVGVATCGSGVGVVSDACAATSCSRNSCTWAAV